MDVNEVQKEVAPKLDKKNEEHKGDKTKMPSERKISDDITSICKQKKTEKEHKQISPGRSKGTKSNQLREGSKKRKERKLKKENKTEENVKNKEDSVVKQNSETKEEVVKEFTKKSVDHHQKHSKTGEKEKPAAANTETARHGKQSQSRRKENDLARGQKTRTNKTIRTTKDQVKPDKAQSTLTQFFQVRRSERKPKLVAEIEKRLDLQKKILSGNEDGLEVRVLEEKGRGIFSKTPLKRGDLVCEYAGDLINAEEAHKRETEYVDDPAVGCYMYYFVYNDKKYCVDATKESDRLGRLLNHSKNNANVCTRLFPINSRPHLILIAARDIAENEELLYDYGDRSKSAVESHPWLKT